MCVRFRWWLSSEESTYNARHHPVMQETRVRSLGQKDPQEKEMATHCSILAWRIPWTEEPGGLQSLGSQESVTTWQLHHHHHHQVCVYLWDQLKKNRHLIWDETLKSLKHGMAFCSDEFSFPPASHPSQGLPIISHWPGSLPLPLTPGSGIQLVPYRAFPAPLWLLNAVCTNRS